jgi:hypothetical protein
LIIEKGFQVLSSTQIAGIPSSFAPPMNFVPLSEKNSFTLPRIASVNFKRWAVLFSCLSCRVVHIEVIEEMSTSSFINALRRFMAIRGKVKEFFSDRGTKFIGGAKELGL